MLRVFLVQSYFVYFYQGRTNTKGRCEVNHLKGAKMSGPNWKLEDDLKRLTVTFPTQPPVALQLDAAGVDDLLRNLGEMRAYMKPAHPEKQALGQKVGAIPDPAWAIEPDLLLRHSLLHLRDPRYGWLHFLLPPNEAEKLGQVLQTHAQSQPPVPPPTSKSH